MHPLLYGELLPVSEASLYRDRQNYFPTLKLPEVNISFFKADLFDYRPDTEYDIIFSSGVFHFIQQTARKELCDSLKEHTADNGINAMNVFVKKPFIKRTPVPSGKYLIVITLFVLSGINSSQVIPVPVTCILPAFGVAQ